MKYFIEVDDLGIEWADAGPWRSYSLSSDGKCLMDLITNASISETDQDGGEIDTYGIEDAPLEVQVEAYEVIGKEYAKQIIEETEREKFESHYQAEINASVMAGAQ